MMLLSLSSFSQKDIKTNDSLVCIPKAIAIKVAKELNEKDKLSEENNLLKKDTSYLLQIVDKYKKDSALLEVRNNIHISIINDYKAKEALYVQTIADKNKEIKKSKFRTTLSQITLILSLLFIASRI